MKGNDNMKNNYNKNQRTVCEMANGTKFIITSKSSAYNVKIFNEAWERYFVSLRRIYLSR
jgi:hypothetical protein